MLLEKRPKGAKPYQFPTVCPVCGSHAVRELNPRSGREDSVRRCTGALICPAQAVERLRHFVGRDAFDIEGFGEKQVQAFYAEGLVMEPADIFTLDARDKRAAKKLAEREGYGETSTRNLFAAIEARRTIPLNRLIYALGIRHVGETNARLLARHFGTIEAFQTGVIAAGEDEDSEAFRELTTIEGIGEVVGEAIVEFFKEKHNREAVERLLEQITATPMETGKARQSRRRQDRGLHRLPGEDDARGGQGDGRAAGRQSFRLGVEEDRSRRRRSRRGLQAEGRAEARGQSADGR